MLKTEAAAAAQEYSDQVLTLLPWPSALWSRGVLGGGGILAPSARSRGNGRAEWFAEWGGRR